MTFGIAVMRPVRILMLRRIGVGHLRCCGSRSHRVLMPVSRMGIMRTVHRMISRCCHRDGRLRRRTRVTGMEHPGVTLDE